jgi:hypothetical protein
VQGRPFLTSASQSLTKKKSSKHHPLRQSR